MTDREEALEKASTVLYQVAGAPDGLAAAGIIADALLEWEAQGVETGAELTPAICVCPNEEVASSGIHERGCPAGIHRRCRERAAELRAQIRGGA